MIPLFKVFSLFLRVFSKPLLNYTKKVHSNHEAQSLVLRGLFIRFGNYYHSFDSAVNRRFLKINSQFAFKPLSDELALEKGIQFLYQILFYSIVLGLPIFELWKGQVEAVEKEESLNQKLTALEEGTEVAMKRLEQTLVQLGKGYKTDFL